jgi:hypothetical protein
MVPGGIAPEHGPGHRGAVLVLEEARHGGFARLGVTQLLAMRRPAPPLRGALSTRSSNGVFPTTFEATSFRERAAAVTRLRRFQAAFTISSNSTSNTKSFPASG